MESNIPQTQRELFLTPAVKSYLEKFGHSENAKLLVQDIYAAIIGQIPKEGGTVLTASPFCLEILDPVDPFGPERVIVWQSPDDGENVPHGSILENIGLDDAVLEKAMASGMGLM